MLLQYYNVRGFGGSASELEPPATEVKGSNPALAFDIGHLITTGKRVNSLLIIVSFSMVLQLPSARKFGEVSWDKTLCGNLIG